MVSATQYESPSCSGLLRVPFRATSTTQNVDVRADVRMHGVERACLSLLYGRFR